MAAVNAQHDHGTHGHGQHLHAHDHAHGIRSNSAGSRKGLLIALTITAFMMVAEIVGGLLSNSLALLSDAGHMFTDTLALALSFFAMKFAEMPATDRKTYGFYRLEILAALANGAILLLVSAYILYEAYLRIRDPEPVQSTLMLIVAGVGLAVNILGALFLMKYQRSSLNIRGAFLHILGDAVSSVGVIGGGTVISLTGWYLIDPILSILIALGIIVGAGGLVMESANILLESVPSHLDIGTIEKEIANLPGVREAYHIHLWTITSGVYALSAHVIVDDRTVSSSRELLNAIRGMLSDRFNILHSTVQLECERCDVNGVCSLPTDVQERR